MRTSSHTLRLPLRIVLLGYTRLASAVASAGLLVACGAGLLVACGAGLLVACGSAGEPPSALSSAGGSSSSGGSANAGASGGGSSSAGSSNSSGSDAGGSGAEGGECNVQTFERPPASATHTLECADIIYSTTPPSGGNHYAIWAAFQSYDYPLPAGFVVHDLEHGAIVFWYDCPEGCPDEVAEVQAFIDSQPEDPLCDGFTAARRAVLVPYPGLGARWAASAWGFALTAECFDRAEFGAFYTAHYGNGPESFCNDGQVIPENACP
jgi:hypothetical protein